MLSELMHVMASTKRDLEEKKRLDQAVAKVREVVHSASKNDIVLVLHQFDLDVDKAIQAFCDDGGKTALGSWERSGATKKKDRKNKQSAGPDTVSETDAPSTVASKDVTDSNGSKPFNPPYYNSKPNGRSYNPVRNNNRSTGNYRRPPPSSFAVVNEPQAGDNRRLPLKVPSGSTAVNGPQRNEHAYKNTDSEEETCSLEISSLSAFGDEVRAVEAAFEKEISIAEDSVRNVFKSLRQLLTERENHLLAELKRTHDDGVRILAERRVKASGLLDRAKRIKAMSDREKGGFYEEIVRFSAERNDEADFAHGTRFTCDSKQMAKMIKNFAEVVDIKVSSVASALTSPLPSGDVVPAVNDIKMSLERSSRASSAGEDSGLGQISPNGVEQTNVAEVNDGGILMKSDAFTADQLADLNAQVREALKAQGIDASLLSGGAISARRRHAGVGRAKPRPPKPQPPKPDPQLSIFE